MKYSRLLVWVIACFCSDSVFGLSVIPRPWQAEVFEADFIGIVRCIKPGGDYEVVDAWKHVGEEAVLKIHHSERYHRIGQEFLALLNTFSPPDHPKKLVSWNGFQSPNKWRILPDRKYMGQLVELSWLEERRRNREREPVEWGGPYHYSFFVQMAKSNRDLKRQIQNFSSQSEESQEYDILVSSMEMSHQRAKKKAWRPIRWPFQKKKVARLIHWMFRHAGDDSGKSSTHQSFDGSLLPLFHEGRFHTLKTIASIPVDQFPVQTHYAYSIKTLSEKLTESERKQIDYYPLSKKEEFEALKSVISRDLNLILSNAQNRSFRDPEMTEKLKDFKKRVAGMSSLESLLEALTKSEHPVLKNFLSFGGHETFRWLQENSKATQWSYEKEQLSWRLGYPVPSKREDKNELKRRIEKNQSVLKQSLEFQKTIPMENLHQLSVAIEYLTPRKPAVVAKFLKSFNNPMVVQSGRNFSTEKHWIYEAGYFYASFFGHLCEEHRNEYLFSLLNAKDDFVQAAAAIYLSFDPSETAISKLKQKAELQGVPGAWAALALVRRGYAEFMPKAMALYQPYPYDLVKSRDSGSIRAAPSEPRLFYEGPWPTFEFMLSQHISHLSEKYTLNPPTFSYTYSGYPWNEQANAQRQQKYEVALEWWEDSKAVIKDTRDPLIDQWIAQRID